MTNWWADVGWRWALGVETVGQAAWALSVKSIQRVLVVDQTTLGRGFNSFGESFGNWAWGLGANVARAFQAMIDTTLGSVRGWINTLLGWLDDLVDALKGAWKWMQRVGDGGEQPPARPRVAGATRVGAMQAAGIRAAGIRAVVVGRAPRQAASSR